ncbi:M56 family metallopeptidase [Lysinibacillus sp. NPDC093216]|uniref:M56 family metallopeptidase n=1 Tax=Lysinibacillus sp. NPDC093216 TaxID=3390576 RepID=UPI003D08F85B
MNEWLRILVTLSVAGSIVLSLSFLITYVTKELLTAKWNYLSRKLSLFFFLVPIFVFPELLIIFRKTNNDIALGNQTVALKNTLTVSLTAVQVLFAIWIVGVIGKSVWSFYSYQRFNKQIKVSSFLVPKESEVHQLLTKNMDRMNCSSDIEIMYNKCNISPILIGILKPTIVLPMYKIPNDELEMVIKRELIHFKKKDLWIRRFMLIATIIHWYNPLIYLLKKEVLMWSELSCDEDVVMKMSHVERKKYGETILNMIERSNEQSNSYIYGTTFSTEQMNLKRRLMKMLKVKKMSKPVIALSTVALLALASIGVGGATLAQKNTPSISGEIIQEENKVATLVSSNGEKEESKRGFSELISVKMSDESKFTKDEWQKVLKQIEKGEVHLEE